ncbi:MAG: hypothetical protein WCM93_16950 [Bacteroidota bacterium]
MAYVGSTLPIELLNYYIEEWNIQTIFLTSNKLVPSYTYLIKYHRKVRIKILPKNFLQNIVVLFSSLLKFKVIKYDIYFFHESCWPWFDLFVKLIGARGIFIPQIDNSGRKEVDYKYIEENSRFARILKFMNLHNLFRIYAQFSDGSQKNEFVYSIKIYPKSIKVYDLHYSRELITNRKPKKYAKKSKKIIILSGRDCVDDEILSSVYYKIIDFAEFHNYQTFVKDHPSESGRLNLQDKRIINIDPCLPVELIEDDFAYAIGVASAGLLFFEERAVSIIQVIEGISKDAMEQRKKHLTSIPGGEQIYFLKNIAEFDKLLI